MSSSLGIPARGSFMQSYGSRELDASLLLLTTGFLPASDPRVAGTIAAVERELVVDGFVLRYNTGRMDATSRRARAHFSRARPGLPMTGRLDEARQLFTRLLSLRTDLGLLPEEYDVGTKRLVGKR